MQYKNTRLILRIFKTEYEAETVLYTNDESLAVSCLKCIRRKKSNYWLIVLFKDNQISLVA